MKKVYSVEGQVEIKNANGTAGRDCGCGTWIKHWSNYSKKKPAKCSVEGCNNNGSDGAHITRPNANNEKYKTHPYIVPMCSSHNGKHGQKFTSKTNITFVWANVAETCGA